MRKSLIILDSWDGRDIRDLKFALYLYFDPLLYGRNALFMSRMSRNLQVMDNIEEKARHKKKSYVALGRAYVAGLQNLSFSTGHQGPQGFQIFREYPAEAVGSVHFRLAKGAICVG